MKYIDVLTLAICLALLMAAHAPAAAQEQKDTSVKGQSANPAIVLPIVGKGTANYIPVFTGNYIIGNSMVSQTGNGLSVAGNVSAVSFIGSGSGLTNVPAVQLGGLPASAFAQTSASNTFTADQTITGNLNLTGYINSAFSLQGNLTDANGQEGVNVLGGFPGNAAFGGNTIAPGTIGATIGGGGGAYDPSLLPKRPVRKELARPAVRAGAGAMRNPFLRRSPVQGNAEESSEPEQAPPPGLVSGGNGIVVNALTGAPSNWGTIAGGLQNIIYSPFATIGGGYGNRASANYSTVAGGDGNTASALEATVAGGTNNSASDVNSTVGGGMANTASGAGDGIGSATVAGGSFNGAVGDDSTVGGGYENSAGNGGVVAGGALNSANSSVDYNLAPTVDAAVGGGEINTANGNYSVVPGGYNNNALGDDSFAAGCNATAYNTSSFVWGGAGEGNISCLFVHDTGPNQFVALAPGGFYFWTASDESVGAALASGSGSWSSLSDRNVKANFLAIDPGSLLKKLAAMPISTWNYKTQAESIRHLGPTAQDFHDAFGLGEDDKHISTVDAQGVALAGIQALYQTVTQLKQNLADKDREIDDLRARLADLEQAISAVATTGRR